MNEKKKRCSIIWFQNIIPAMYTVIPIKEKSTTRYSKSLHQEWRIILSRSIKRIFIKLIELNTRKSGSLFFPRLVWVARLASIFESKIVNWLERKQILVVLSLLHSRVVIIALENQ